MRTPPPPIPLALAFLLAAGAPVLAQPGPLPGTAGGTFPPAAPTTAAPSAEDEEAPSAEEEEVPDAQAYLARHLSGRDASACMPKVDLGRKPSLPGQRAASAEPAPLRRLVLAVDASGSMRAKSAGEPKIEAAKRAAAEFLSGVPDDVEVGLVVFGHRGSSRPEGKAESCAGVETVYEIAPANREAVRAAVDGFAATGWTPLAAAIEEAGASFRPAENPGEQVVYVVSDGLETCGGDPAAAARRLRESDIKAVVNIIGFDIAKKDRAQLQAVAAAGGGRFVEANTGRDLQRRLAEQLANANRATAASLAASNAQTAARLKVSNAVTGARLCVSNLITAERLRVTNAITADRLARRDDPALSAEVLGLMQERHVRISAALDEYAGALESEREERVGEIVRDLERALAVPGGR